MDVYEAIEKRRTIRIYKKRATEEQVRRLLLAGSKAPSGGNRQPWEFIIIDDQKIIDQLGKTLPSLPVLSVFHPSLPVNP